MNNKQYLNRINWIDALKGLSIFFVIVGHNINVEYGFIPTVTKSFIYSWHIPLFFFLSGICFSTKDNIRNFIIKKIRTLIIPMVVFSIINILVDYIFYGLLLNTSQRNIEYLINSLIGIILQQRGQTYNSYLWFLPCMFWVQILLYLLVKFLKTKRNLVLVMLMLFTVGILFIKFVGIMLPWEIETSLIALIFTGIGFIVKDNIHFLGKVSKWYSIIAFVICGIITYINTVYNGEHVDLATNTIGLPITYLIGAFSGICGWCILFYKMNNIKILNYIGKNSLIYYSFSTVGIIIPNIIMFNILSVNPKSLGEVSVLFAIYCGVASCLCIWPISLIINRYFKSVLGKQR